MRSISPHLYEHFHLNQFVLWQSHKSVARRQKRINSIRPVGSRLLQMICLFRFYISFVSVGQPKNYNQNRVEYTQSIDISI